ncbi:MAG: hypothetical protein IPO92_06465 [Saprospiraceae bacterium]|nr:hypothetical protein [Saprospiraceae bacterium]
MKDCLKVILSLLSIVFIGSCSLTDNEMPVPAFISITEVKVKAPKGPEFDTHKITDIWVFVDGQIIGIFPMPADRIPLELVGNNDVELMFLAGIRNNGMNDTPVFYPFYQTIKKVISPKANQIIEMALEFEYVSTALIPLNESFEIGNQLSYDMDNNVMTYLTINNENASLGKNSGLASLTGNQTFFEVGTESAVRETQNARGSSYIEFDYKGEGEISVGIAKTRNGFTQKEYLLFVPGKSEWNKIYVDATDKLSPRDYDEYRIILGFRKTGSSAVSKIYIDNVKHVHF